MNKTTETNRGKNAVIYCRVSTKEQAEEGNSLASQERICREYATKEGFDVVEVFIERGESAKTTDRTELKRLMTLCTSKKGSVHAVIAYKVDRISRSIADYSHIRVLLRKYGVEIRSVTEFFEDTPAGRFMENIIANVGQFDNDVRTERSIGGMKQAALEGRYVWKAPPGYSNSKINGKSTIVQNENAPLIKLAFELIAQRTHSTEAIRIHLLDKGLKSNQGVPVSRSHFFVVLRNPVYKGVIQKFGITYPGTFDPIVSKELFDEVQAILKGRKFNSKQYLHENPDFPLRRFVKDPQGNLLTGYWSSGRRLKYPYYSFSLPGTTIRKEELEDRFMKFLSQYAFNYDHLRVLKKYLTIHFEKRAENKENDKESIQKRIEEINSEIDNLLKLEKRGSISITLFESRTAMFEQELIELHGLLRRKEKQVVDIGGLLAFAIRVLKNPILLWQRLPFEKQKALQWFEFPDGITYDGEKFRTTKVCSLFKLISEIDRQFANKADLSDDTKNTYSNISSPPSSINLLETKAFWDVVAHELIELKKQLGR